MARVVKELDAQVFKHIKKIEYHEPTKNPSYDSKADKLMGKERQNLSANASIENTAIK
jgi:hypothetical protein